MQYENERMEFKSQLTDDIYKEVIAFTNTDGGVIYIGIDDQGNVTGIDNVDETYTRLTNGIRDAIQPDVTMFVRYVLQENKVIRIEVGESNSLALCNRTVSTIKGVVRTDKQDYPEEAIREALLNALVHRDYSFSGSIIINVNDSKMEFISLGGLLPGLSTEDIRLGVSQPRNKKLAEIFHRLRLIESYGTGIRRIFKLYASCPVQPSIEATTNAFRIVLPNMNAVSAGEENAAEAKPAAPVITPQMKIVLDYLKEYGEMRDEELQELLHIKKTRAYLLTRQMSEEGLIEVVGRGAKKTYRLK